MSDSDPKQPLPEQPSTPVNYDEIDDYNELVDYARSHLEAAHNYVVHLQMVVDRIEKVWGLAHEQDPTGIGGQCPIAIENALYELSEVATYLPSEVQFHDPEPVDLDPFIKSQLGLTEDKEA